MQVVKKCCFYLVVILVSIIVFMPKESLYFTLERTLQKQGVEINEAGIDPGLFSLTLTRPVIYFQGIRIATVKKIRFDTLLFYSRVRLDNIEMEKGFAGYFPSRVPQIVLTHSILRPFRIYLNGEGTLQGMHGWIDFRTHKMHVYLAKIDAFGMFRSQLHKDVKGGWYYETSF